MEARYVSDVVAEHDLSRRILLDCCFTRSGHITARQERGRHKESD